MFSLRQVRVLSTFTNSEIEAAKKWLENTNLAAIPRHLFTISYSRSSGPGGQKVNKTSSKATISLEPHQWLNPQFCFWMPPPVLYQVKQANLRHQTKSGGILIQSDGSRSRENNTDECFRKLLQDIKDNVYFADEVSVADKKKWEELAVEQKERRMMQKKRQSDKKKLRLKHFDM